MMMSNASTEPSDPTPTAPYERASSASLTATPPPPVAPPPAPPPAPLVRRSDQRPGRISRVVFGLIVIAVGLWFVADLTLGLDMPSLSWGQLWPIFLILLGGWLLVTSMRRR